MPKIKIPKPCKCCGRRMDPPFTNGGGGWYCSKACSKHRRKGWWCKPGRPNYHSYLESSAWRERRKLVLERANGKCEYCTQQAPVFHVHHMTYDRLGKEHMADLMALCPDCHAAAHGKGKVSKRAAEITRHNSPPPSFEKTQLARIALARENEDLHYRQQSENRELAKRERKERRRKSGNQKKHEQQKRKDLARQGGLDPSSPFRYLTSK